MHKHDLQKGQRGDACSLCVERARRRERFELERPCAKRGEQGFEKPVPLITSSMSCVGPSLASPLCKHADHILQCLQNHRSLDHLLAERPLEGIKEKELCKLSGVVQSSKAKL